MLGIPNFRCGATNGTFGLEHLEKGILKQGGAVITLITFGIFGAALGAGALNVPISQANLAAPTIKLFDCLSINIPIFIDKGKDFMGELSVMVGAGTTEIVAGDVEPFVDAGVEVVVSVADFCWSGALLEGFYFCRGAILIGSAHKQSVVAP
jgi:hypothetical protein